jgi:hypothetical protein
MTAFAVPTTPGIYVGALTLLSFGFLFVTPFVTAIAIRIDGSGGLASAAQGTQMIASAIGPGIGGALLANGSFAVDHAGTDGSSAGDRMHRHGVWSGLQAEEMSLGQSTAEAVVSQLIIDASDRTTATAATCSTPRSRGPGSAAHPTRSKGTSASSTLQAPRRRR